MKIDIDRLSKWYDGKEILRELSLHLEDVSTLAVTGPSGGGKSTLLRILAGLQAPGSGSVALDGKELRFEPDALHAWRKSIGVVFQAYNLFPHYSALENIVLPMTAVHGIPRAEALDRACGLLERFRLMEHKDKKPGQLSGGQQQRIAIARAIAVSSGLLLLDEPTSALDPFMTREVLDMLRELASENRTLVMVTHEISFAAAVCDHMVYLEDGRIKEAGQTADVIRATGLDAGGGSFYSRKD
jgi:polar amino acid transport system ATP-binding protein